MFDLMIDRIYHHSLISLILFIHLIITIMKTKVIDVKAAAANDVDLVNADDQAIKDQAITDATKNLEIVKLAYETAKADLKKLTGKAPKAPKISGPGVIATIFTLVSNSKKGISKQELIDELVKLFPDRNRDGMLKTIQVQLPSRMNKEKKVNIVKENDKFLIK